MANQIIPFQPNQVPAHIQKFIDGNSNIAPRVVVNQLSFRGKVWRKVIDGDEIALVNKDDEPVSTVHMVVLDYNKGRSRSYYEGAYEEGKSKPPVCWSMDGLTPDESVTSKQSKACDGCQWSVKGSKITPAGKETTACSVFQRLAVVPLGELDSAPLLLRLAQTSMWDGRNEENEAKGYYAWQQYVDMLRKSGATHTGAVATKVRFDSRMSYPKLVFAASRWLEDEELALVKEACDSQAVAELLNTSESAAAARKPKAAEVDEDEAPAVLPPKKAKAAPAPVEDEDEAPPPPKAKKAAPAPAPVEDDDDDAPPPPKAKKAAPKAAPVEDDDEAPPPPAKAKPPKAAAKVIDVEPEPAKPAKGNGLAALVEEWDD
jgi:hypothetical protein